MAKRGYRAAGLMVASWVLAVPAVALGQMSPVPPRPQGTLTPGAVLTNPYLNGTLNPYLNPGGAAQPIGAGNAALYLFAAQAAHGGIGSGRLSGTETARPAPRLAVIPDSMGVPGAGASRYFNPGPVNVNGAGRYFGRRNRSTGPNGR